MRCHFLYIENATTPESSLILKRASVLIHITENEKRRRFVGIFLLLTTLGHVFSVQPVHAVTEILVKVTTYNVSFYETETKMCSFNENKRESGK